MLTAARICGRNRWSLSHHQIGPEQGPDQRRSNLGLALRDAGRLGEALPLFERTLADREQVLAVDHPDTLDSRTNLADALKAAGRLGEALPLYERVLADRERLLGPDNHTLAARTGESGPS